MSLLAGLFVVLAAFVTATVSGVLGMAGGLLLLGALLLVLPVAVAFVAHGLLQLVSNGSRALIQRRYIGWRTVGAYAVGAVAAAVLVALLAVVPSKPVTYLLLGLVPGLVWVPRDRLNLDAARPAQAIVCGALVTALNLTAGVAGPLLDIFFVRTSLGRHRIVATKAATQVLSHLAKVLVYGGTLLANDPKSLPWLVVLAAAPLSVLGTHAGGRLLERLCDARFRSLTRVVVTMIGMVYLVQALVLAT